MATHNTADKPAATKDAGEAEVQQKVNEAEAKGHFGTKVDPTPNSHYTVAGVAAGKPTPETDSDHALKVAAELRNRA